MDATAWATGKPTKVVVETTTTMAMARRPRRVTVLVIDIVPPFWAQGFTENRKYQPAHTVEDGRVKSRYANFNVADRRLICDIAIVTKGFTLLIVGLTTMSIALHFGSRKR